MTSGIHLFFARPGPFHRHFLQLNEDVVIPKTSNLVTKFWFEGS